MKTCCNRFLMMGSVVMFLALAGKASANHSDVVVEVQGSPSCSLLASKKIMELKDSQADIGSTTITNPKDGQTITYTIKVEGDGLSWLVAKGKPVSFAILTRANGDSRVIYYPNIGANFSDTNLFAGGTIIQVAFCYGIAQPTPLAACPPGFCPAPNAVVITLDPDRDQWGLIAPESTCSCGRFEQCNPDAKVGSPGACTQVDAELPFPPVDVLAGQDPWVCLTIGSERKCYRKDGDPSPTPLPPCKLCKDPKTPLPQNAVQIILDPDKVQWGLLASESTCSCGTFQQCDPDLEVGLPGACTQVDAELPFPPVDVSAGQDPWVCFTVGGKRKCYCKDSKPAITGCQ